MTVERAGLTDIDALVELRLAYLSEDLGSIDEADRATIVATLPDYLRSHLGRDLFAYVVRDGQAIISCALLLVTVKPMSPSFINGKTGTVLNVYTRPTHRHQGCARKVMEALLADARAQELSTVELKSTEDGYHLYQAVGFVDDTSKYHNMVWRNR